MRAAARSRTLRGLIAAGYMLSGLASASCGRTGSAPVQPNGQRIAIIVQVDGSTLQDAAPDRVSQLREIASWTESDLVAVLKKTGYAAAASRDPAAAPGPGRYLLHLWIDDFNTGEHALRFVIGHSRGAAGLRTHYALYGAGSATPLLTGAPDVEAKRDWRAAARGVERETADAVSAKLRQARP